jgi:DNA-binding MarR family transcriptional regulator
MKDKHTAAELMALCEENWPRTYNQTHRFAVYVNRTCLLGVQEVQEIVREKRLSLGEFDVLASLRSSPSPYRLPPTELQRATLITSGGLTKLLYQLEARGLVERSVHEADRRRKLVHLTRKGERLVEATMNKVTERESEWVEAALNEGELEQLNQLLGKVLGVLEQRK